MGSFRELFVKRGRRPAPPGHDPAFHAFDPPLIARSTAGAWGLPMDDLPNGAARERAPAMPSWFPAESGGFTQMEDELSECHRALISAVIRRPLDEQGFDAFISMHPGIRDLRMRNFVSSLWNDPDYKEKLPEYRRARGEIYDILGIPGPSESEKLHAIMQTGELTDFQQSFVSSLYFGTRRHVEARHVSEARRVLMRKNPEELPLLWRKGAVDFITIADLAHKLRFTEGGTFANEEMQLLSMLWKTMGVRNTTVSEAEYGRLRKAFEEMAPQEKSRGEYTGRRIYNPYVFSLWLISNKLQKYNSLRNAAMAEEEFHTMAEFLGAGYEKAIGTLDYRFGMTRMKKREPHNDDNYSGALIRFPDGGALRADAVWDGMGGHEHGAVASGIAKEVFEISALAGWMREPEDLRKVALMSDLAIVFAQIASAYDASDPSLRDPRLLGKRVRKNEMGTTARMTLQAGNDIYELNIGDSDFRIFFNGGREYRPVHHDMSYEFRLTEKRQEAERQVRDELSRSGTSIAAIGAGAFERRVQATAERLLSRDSGPPGGSVIWSAMGGLSHYVQINGTSYFTEAASLARGAVVELATDGISDTTCPHEHEREILGARGDLSAARMRIMELSSSRDSGDRSYSLSCGCRRTGKDDDRTLVLRRADEGFDL
ncbi:MAG: protein phosphatase 2C domain-containing protein [Candidatus Micrarchaeota archaeon]